MTDPDVLALDLRDSLRPLWRRLNSYKSLSASKIGILFHLEQSDAHSVSSLASAIHVSHQAVAAAARELQDKGLVSRQPDTADGRRVLLQLTAAGARQLATERTSGQAWLTQALADRFDDSERAALATALPLLRRLAAEDPR